MLKMITFYELLFENRERYTILSLIGRFIKNSLQQLTLWLCSWCYPKQNEFDTMFLYYYYYYFVTNSKLVYMQASIEQNKKFFEFLFICVCHSACLYQVSWSMLWHYWFCVRFWFCISVHGPVVPTSWSTSASARCWEPSQYRRWRASP